ncbi:MAG TPA: hypothetical protein VMM27_01165 [Casimicrobiaceae bacterium]|nr:hypothetical protein [Casimicrobiaceae bacterium]
MILAGEIDYAQARLSARYGERPSESEWRTIEAIRRLPALLEAARGLRFRRWLVGIAPAADPHAIEAALIARWRAEAAEVRSWMPAAWRAALEWMSVLPDVPVAEYIARGGQALGWMRDDPVYGPLCEAGRPTERSPLAPLTKAWNRPDGLFGAWRREWIRRMPQGALAATAGVDQIARELAAYRGAPAAAVSGDGIALRRALASRLSLQFRRVTLEPSAALVYLALIALDLERLRGELLRRAIFPGFGLAA